MGADSGRRGQRFATRAHSIGLAFALLAPVGAGAAEPASQATAEVSHPEVLVVVNDASPVSVAIGEAYRRSRGVPVGNVVHLDVPLGDPTLVSEDHETIDRTRYVELVRDPIARFLQENGLVERIQIIVTTKGVPLRIPDASEDVPYAERRAASVDAELAVLFSPLEGSAGVAGAANPYFRSALPFAAWRNRYPDAPLRYLVARLTGYADAPDPDTGVPRDIAALLEHALAPDPGGVWVIDEDPRQGVGRQPGNLAMLRPAAAALAALELTVVHDRESTIVQDVDAVAGYASWGSNDLDAPPAPHYGEIDGHRYPGRFAPRSVAVTIVSTNARTFSHVGRGRRGQSLVADLVHEGVAGVAGCVFEPILSGVARPMLLADYARGVPAAEAFYRNVPYLSWMNVWVGDPLMRVARPAAAARDGDGDGVPDPRDDCTEMPDPAQRDGDGDGIGDLCDGDFDGDGIVGLPDLSRLTQAVRSDQPFPGGDLDGDGAVDEIDLWLLHARLFLPPGPASPGRRRVPVPERGQP